MDAKKAITTAKSLLTDLYAEEAVSEIRLEEIEFDEHADSWRITLGIMRPALPTASSPLLGSLNVPHAVPLKRTYKVVTIPDSGSQKPSVKIRELSLDE